MTTIVDWGVAMRVAQENRDVEGEVGVLAEAFVQLHSRFVSKPIPLTKREAEVLQFLADYVTDNGYAPTQAEVGKHFGFSSPATASEVIANDPPLAVNVREHNSVRGIVVVHWPQKAEVEQ